MNNVEPAIDKNGIQYGWKCRSSNHVWIGKEDAEKCCDPTWRRDLTFVSLQPYFTCREWVKID